MNEAKPRARFPQPMDAAVSPRFAGMKTLARHRLVYDAMGPLMQGRIHALAIRAMTPDEL